MDMTFVYPCLSDANKPALGPHLAQVSTTRVAHTRPQPTNELVKDIFHRPLVRDPPFNSFGYQFPWIAFFALEIPILRTLLHCAQ